MLALPESEKRPRRGDGDESDSSEEPLEGTKPLQAWLRIDQVRNGSKNTHQ